MQNKMQKCVEKHVDNVENFVENGIDEELSCGLFINFKIYIPE